MLCSPSEAVCRLYSPTGKLLATERGVVDHGSAGDTLVVMPLASSNPRMDGGVLGGLREVWLALDKEQPRPARVQGVYSHPRFGRACVLRIPEP
jgi:hypothetical protein